MNILHISRHFWPVIGGTEIVMQDFAERQASQGHNCRVLCINRNTTRKADGYFSRFEKLGNIEIFRVSAFGSHKKPFPNPFDIFRIFSLLKWADIVHLHDVRFLLEIVCFFKYIFGYKIVLNTNGLIFHTKDFSSTKEILFKYYYVKIFNIFFDRILAISERDLSFLEGVAPTIKCLFESALDTEKFFKINKDVKKNIFLYFGRIDKNKGLENLFKSLSLLNLDWVLNIVGSGESAYIEKLKTISRDLKIDPKLKWLGKVPEKELHQRISEAHIAFFPSLEEGFGLTYLESLATNTLTIGNAIPTFTKIMYDIGSGCVVNFNNHESVRDLVLKIIEKNIFCAEIDRNKFIPYDINHKIDSLLSLYEKLLKK